MALKTLAVDVVVGADDTGLLLTHVYPAGQFPLAGAPLVLMQV
jgi:hypothetical protein